MIDKIISEKVEEIVEEIELKLLSSYLFISVYTMACILVKPTNKSLLSIDSFAQGTILFSLVVSISLLIIYIAIIFHRVLTKLVTKYFKG